MGKFSLTLLALKLIYLSIEREKKKTWTTTVKNYYLWNLGETLLEGIKKRGKLNLRFINSRRGNNLQEINLKFNSIKNFFKSSFEHFRNNFSFLKLKVNFYICGFWIMIPGCRPSRGKAAGVTDLRATITLT